MIKKCSYDDKSLFIIPHAPYGHLDNRIEDFRNHPDVPVIKRVLAIKKDFQRIIFVSGSKYIFDRPVMFDNIEYHTIKGDGTLRGFLKTYDIKLLVLFLSLVLRYHRNLRVLNFSMASSSVIISILSRCLRITFLTYFTGVPEQAEMYMTKILLDYKLLMIFSQNIASNNLVVSRRLREICNRTDFSLIPNFVEEEFKPKGNSREQFSILYVGRLEPEKRVDHLLRAFSIVVRKLPKAKLYIIGMGSRYSTLKELTNKLGLGEQVRFLGWVPHEDIPLWMNRCKIFIQPSLYEGFPNAPLEALACGMALIAMDVSYARWAFGTSALFANPHSISSLAKYIHRLLVDKKYLTLWAEKGRHRVSIFKKEKVVKKLVEAIE